MPLLFYFIITLISGVSQGQTGIFNVVKGVGDGEGVHIFNPQLLIDHSTEANVISIFSFKNTEVVQLLFIFYRIKYVYTLPIPHPLYYIENPCLALGKPQKSM
jgi:hypothetical protein